MTTGKKAAAKADLPFLPAAYAPFAPVLDLLSTPLQQILYGQLAQFERLAPNFEAQEFAAQGEFEGLGGLTMRGEIAHVVQSELLLRTEAPLEFLRRLAESETLFLEKQYADPGVRSVYRAMISVGPGLLGHGRLVALAALFFMARIARSRGAAFHWCFLPREAGVVWFDDISVNGIKRFLRAASYREMVMDDVAEAQQLWETLARGANTDADPDYIDWVIGASPRGPALRARHGSALAIEDAPGTLAFIQSSSAEEQRSACVAVRQSGKDRMRATIVFPDDLVCVSALNTPFAPLKPADIRRIAGPPRQRMPGWAPQYLVIPRFDTKIVRVPDGLLILIFGTKSADISAWLVRLDEGVRLAGMRLDGWEISVVLSVEVGGREKMAFHTFDLSDDSPQDAGMARACEVPTRHLFRNQPPWSIPPLTPANGVEVYSDSGQTFLFRFDSTGSEARFLMQHKEPKTLYSNGIVRVVRVDRASPSLRVLKAYQRPAAEYAEGLVAVSADRLLGMVYSSADHGLAYSVSPNSWLLPQPAGGPPEPVGSYRPGHQEIQLQPYETLLEGKIWGETVSARIWSDARHGGDGTVRAIRRRNGDTVVKQPMLKLGADAGSIVKIQLGDDGLWAVKVDADGVPSELLHYRLFKKRSRFETTRFDLEILRANATILDPGARRG